MKKHLWLSIVLPSAVIGIGAVLAIFIKLFPGIIMMGAGIALLAFGTACAGLDLVKTPDSDRRKVDSHTRALQSVVDRHPQAFGRN